MVEALLFPGLIIAVGVVGIVSKRTTLHYSNTWRTPRAFLCFGLIFAASLLLVPGGYFAVAGFVLIGVVFSIDSTIGALSASQVPRGHYMTFSQELSYSRIRLRELRHSIKSRFSSTVAPSGWNITFRTDSALLNTIGRVFDWSQKSTVVLFLLLYGVATLLILSAVAVFLILLLASVAGGDDEVATLFRKVGSIYLSAYGPGIVATWAIGYAILVSFGALVGDVQRRKRPLQIFKYFAGSMGIGAAVGMLSGVMAPSVWGVLGKWGLFPDFINSRSLVADGLALDCSSLGLVLGALFGTYFSLRQYVGGIDNLLYREVSIAGTLAISGWVTTLLPPISPLYLVGLITAQSDIYTAARCADEGMYADMAHYDVAKCLVLEDGGFPLSSNEVLVGMLWTFGCLSLVCMVLNFFRRMCGAKK